MQFAQRLDLPPQLVGAGQDVDRHLVGFVLVRRLAPGEAVGRGPVELAHGGNRGEHGLEARAVGDVDLAAAARLPRVLLEGGLEDDGPEERPLDAGRIEPGGKSLGVDPAKMEIKGEGLTRPMFDNRTKEWKPCLPPNEVVHAILDRGQWDGIRPILGILEAPSIRHDGVLIEAEGYDEASGFLLLPNAQFPRVSPCPTQDDARAAFVLLEEEPGRELVAGVVGPFWQWRRGSRPRLVADTPGRFREALAEGRMAALASFRADPAPGGARLWTETWVHAPAPGQRAAFTAYWLAIGPFSAWIRRMFLHTARARAAPPPR